MTDESEHMTIYRSPEGQREVRQWCAQQLAAWGHPHTMRTLPTSLGSTHVVTSGSGPPVVLLAGTNFAAATWLPLIASLSARHTVHAVDLPGQPGLSAPQRPRRGMPRYGEWLVQLLPTLDASTSTLVGHSLGAAVVMQAMSSGPLAAHAVLLDPAGLMRLRVSAAVLRPTLPWMRRPDERTSAALLRMMMAPGAVPDLDLVRWMSLVGRHVRTSLAPSPLPDPVVARLRCRHVHVLSGRSDPFLPPDRLRRAVRRRLPGASFEPVDGAGHLLPHEQPEVVLHHVREAAHPDGS